MDHALAGGHSDGSELLGQILIGFDRPEGLTEGEPVMLILRSFGAVSAGLLAVVLLSTLTDEIMHATGLIPRGPMWSPAHNTLALGYRCVIGAIGTALATLGVFATAGLNWGPRWYPIALAVSALPTCWLGGWLQRRGG